MSPATASICAVTMSAATADTAVTPTVFWAVMAVMALVPYTPSAANVFRSAWMPAPPPESLPAIVSDGRMRHHGATMRSATVRLAEDQQVTETAGPSRARADSVRPPLAVAITASGVDALSGVGPGPPPPG